MPREKWFKQINAKLLEMVVDYEKLYIFGYYSLLPCYQFTFQIWPFYYKMGVC